LNGENVEEKTKIRHNDRLMLGTSIIFLVKIPGKEENVKDGAELDYEYAQRELEEVSKKKVMEENIRREKERGKGRRKEK